MKKLVFISQGMRGLTDEEIQNEREIAIQHLEEYFKEKEKIDKEYEDGFDVIDSFIHESPNPEELATKQTTGLWYLSKALTKLAKADLLFCHNISAKNYGCMIEVIAARSYGIPVVFDSETVSEIGEDAYSVIKSTYESNDQSRIYFNLIEKGMKPEEIRDDLLHLTFDFSTALILLQRGVSVTRKGWNGKGLRVVYQKAYPNGIPCNSQTAKAWDMKEGDLFKCDPYFQINTTDGSHAMWVPSIRDLLATDWTIC